VATLVAGDRDTLSILLNGGIHDFFDRTVVPQMDDFRTTALQNASKNIDRGVVAVEK
jgi:hypothetical protein